MSDRHASFAAVTANSVHDIKNSISLLLNSLDQFSSDWTEVSPKKRAQIDALRYETRRINSGLIQLLSIYKVEYQDFAANIQEVDVGELLLEMEVENQELLSHKGISLRTENAWDGAGFMDFELVKSVLSALINNAYRYSSSELLLSAYGDGPYLVLAVLDDGAGYPETMIDQQAATVTGLDAATGSTGLGLHFAATIAELHRSNQRRGYTKLDNQGIDGGGRFRLFLP